LEGYAVAAIGGAVGVKACDWGVALAAGEPRTPLADDSAFAVGGVYYGSSEGNSLRDSFSAGHLRFTAGKDDAVDADGGSADQLGFD